MLRDKYETPALATSDAGETTSTVAPIPRLNDDDGYDQPVSVFTVWALGRSYAPTSHDPPCGRLIPR